MTNPLKSVVLYACCLLFLTACGTTPPSHFYLLTPLAGNGDLQQNAEPGILVGPVTLPDYLLRPQIVLRNSENEIIFEEFHRWAEPLQQSFSRVVAENLSLLLGTARVARYPGYKTGDFPYQVLIEVIRMDTGPGRQVSLAARWNVLDRKKKKALAIHKTTLVESVESREYRAVVAAQSRAISRLSREIARAIEPALKDLP